MIFTVVLTKNKMTTDLLKLATAGVQKLHPYQPGKPISELEREYGISEAVKLASNENPLGPSPKVIDVIKASLSDLARYPDGNGHELKTALSSYLGVDTACITLGNGSNDVLEIIARTFVSERDEIMFSEHAFAVYPIVTQAIGATANVVKARDWGHDLEAMAAAITENTRLIFIANPNNPTGTWIDETSLENFLKQVPENVIIVLDEAYFEFIAHPVHGHPEYPNGLKYLKDIPNLIVTRTFSKAYGLAGMRVGYALSHPDIANLLNRVRQPFNVNSLALSAATAALADKEHLEKCIALNAEQYKLYTSELENAGIGYIASAGNFVCVEVGDGAGVYEKLLQQGVITRPVGNYGMPGYLRISIGTEAENRKCLAALFKVLA